MFRGLCAWIVGGIGAIVGAVEAVGDFGAIVRANEPPRSLAEKSNYQSTSRYADVVAFGEALAQQSKRLTLLTLGVSHEGRNLPLWVLAEPPIRSPQELKNSGKAAVLAFANIHAGEVDGKEALLELAREWALGPKPAVLNELVVLLVPLLNADGNERIAPQQRPTQNGPSNGVGQRANAQGLDLNRDFVKLESPELRALVRTVQQWNPLVVIDLHTTNGSFHRYPVTFDGPRHAAVDPALVAFTQEQWFPQIQHRLRQSAKLETFWYGNFSADRTRWEMPEALPRYSTQYFALTGRLGILCESYSYAPFAQRIAASKAFTRACIELASEQRKQLQTLQQQARQASGRVVLRQKLTPWGKEPQVTIRGFVEQVRDGKTVATDQPKDYTATLVGKAESVLSQPLPRAYLIPPRYTSVAQLLQRHGIRVEELREDLELEVESAIVTEVHRQANQFQKHHLVRLETRNEKRRERIVAGAFFVPTDQPLGVFASYLLEPLAEDGLTAWNFFDDALGGGQAHPVARLLHPVPMIRGLPRPLPEDRTLQRIVTVDAFLGQAPPPKFDEVLAHSFTWLDAEHFLQPKEGRLWKIHARTGQATLFVDPDKLQQSLALRKDIPDNVMRQVPKQVHFTMNPQRTAALLTVRGDLYWLPFDGSPVRRLTQSEGGKEFVTFSPDGQKLAFVRKGNLFVVDVETAKETRLTHDGSDWILNGRADWVYEEEIFDRHGQAYWWSPDSQAIAYLRFDDRQVTKFPIVDQTELFGRLEQIAYPKAGTDNPRVEIRVVDLRKAGESIALELHGYDPADTLVARLGWTPDSSQVVAVVMNRIQTWLDVCLAPRSGGRLRRLLRDQTKAWVEDPGEIRFLPDGSFVMTSERTGWRHLLHVSKTGETIRPITQGEWEVRSVLRLDAASGWVWFTATRDASNAENLYRVRLDDGLVERLTTEEGQHVVTLAPQGELFIDRNSAIDRPTQVRLCDSGGRTLRWLDRNPVYLREEYRFTPMDRVRIATPDGFTLEGLLIRPAHFDAAKRYPVWLRTYGGPRTPDVRDAWENGRVFDQALANLGLVIFHVDPRSASGKGAVSAWSAYRQLGVQELKDIETALDWLAQKPYVDIHRVGMSGHSYGGYLTAYCLTHSQRFTAGIASAPVTDWKNYDTIYTERYMSTPKDNPKGYEVSSVLRSAKQLHGRLLIVHGVIDDNVHFQNSLQLIDALQQTDKPFETMIYPRARHGLGSRHYLRGMIDFIRRTMLPADPLR